MTSEAAEAKRREAWGYEPNTPLCSNCVKYRKARVLTTPSGPKAQQPFCSGGKFSVAPGGCCEKWKSKTGERLL